MFFNVPIQSTARNLYAPITIPFGAKIFTPDMRKQRFPFSPHDGWRTSEFRRAEK